MGIDGRFPSPGVDVRFDPPETDWEHASVGDHRFPYQTGGDTRFDNDGADYGVVSFRPPLVLPDQHANHNLPLTEGQVLGTVQATNEPTSWAIVSGNGNGWWAIDNAGVVTATAAGANIVNGGTSAFNVTATNAYGTSAPQAVSITVQWASRSDT